VSNDQASDAPAASRRTHWLLRHGNGLVALLLLLAYTLTFAPGATWNDGPEIVTAVANLGVIHPTGYPLFTMLAHGFVTLIPLPISVFEKVELFNACCAAGAAVLTIHASEQVAVVALPPEKSPDHERLVRIASLAAGLLLGLSPLFWAQVRVAEVYPFHVLLVAWGGWAWIRFVVTDASRYVLWAALAMGMGLAHHVTMVYMLGAAAVTLLVTRAGMFVSWLTVPPLWLARKLRPGLAASYRPKDPWLFVVACLVGATPLLSYGYLMWAATHTSAIPWGGTDNWDKLYVHITAGQYHRFLTAHDLSWYLERSIEIPKTFDRQFLAPGTAAFAIGVVVVLWRAPKLATFLLSYMLLNVGHALYYAVGDFKTYFLPASYVCAVFIAVGLTWVLVWLQEHAERSPLLKSMALSTALLTTATVSLWAYARLSGRIPKAIVGWVQPYGIVAFAVLAVAAFAITIAMARGKLWRDVSVARETLVRLLLGAGALTLAGTTAARAHALKQARIIGMGYAAELSERIPPGGVLLTQGDGFVFSLWHEQHVRGAGRGFAMVDLGNIRTRWYTGYHQQAHPRSCDPLWGRWADDLPTYHQHCDDYAARKARKETSWVSLALRHGPKPLGKAHPGSIVRGADPKCKTDPTYAEEHARKECRCVDYAEKPGPNEQHCVYSHEEGGIVIRSDKEILWQRFVEDHIDTRPVFDRHGLLVWVGSVEENYRGWSGPAYQRISARYALLNRGRFNQVVYAADLERAEPCATLRQPPPIRQPTRAKGRRRGRRAPYLPNERPTLIAASFLTRERRDGQDDATRQFAPGDDVHLHIEWHEQYRWDPKADNHRGARLSIPIQVCLYGPSGERVEVQTTQSGERKKRPKFSLPDAAPLGTYHVQACSLSDERCDRLLLDYDLELRLR
jgi:Protein O-mannosyl-transferase TMEM260-like